MPQWAALTGQSHEQMMGQGWLEAIHPDDRPRTLAAWMTAVEHAALYNTDYRVLCADGAYRWFNARGAPVLNRDGSIREWVGVCLSVPGQNRYGVAPTAAQSSQQTSRPTPETMLTAAQVRAARGMLGLSKDDLARMASVSISTIARLEDGGSSMRPRSQTVQAVREALEGAGAVFTFELGAKPGVREA
jgi:DNA-binding transcriptional regulator YiaG